MNLNLHNKRIGLALSGGGMRAAIFHLGVLKRLAHSGLFEKITSISSVSGASLCMGAIYAVHNNKWPGGREFLAYTLPKVRELMLSNDIQKSALRRLPFSPHYWHRRVEIIADTLEKKWGVNGCIQSLPIYPNAPYWEINCTTFETGRRFRIRRDYMGDYKIGYMQNPNLPISKMIAASAGFPVLIGPYTLRTRGTVWTEHKHGGEEVEVEPRYTLWDGGVYDNLGLEALYKIGRGLDSEVDFIIASDASASIGFQKHRSFASLSNMKRVLDISMFQVYALRIREFHAAVVEREQGAYIPIGERLRHYPTTLRAPNKSDFDLILHNGSETTHKMICK
jgi:NTE family protein